MYKYKTVKKHVYLLLHPDEGDTFWDKLINTFLIVLIILNVLAVMLETMEPVHQQYKQLFKDFDTFSVIIFTIEYVLRLWSSNYHEKYRHSIKGRLKYFFSFGAMIDLIAILPSYLQLFAGGLDLRILRIFRLVRILRLFRLTAYTRSAQMILNVFRTRLNELVLSFVLTFFLIVIASCVLYFAEHMHPVNKNNFTSIPATIWWAVVTLTTTGYGDMVPMTVVGKILSGIIMLTGVAFFALPAGIITAGFLDEIKFIRKNKGYNCPHCGKPIHNHAHHDDDNGDKK